MVAARSLSAAYTVSLGSQDDNLSRSSYRSPVRSQAHSRHQSRSFSASVTVPTSLSVPFIEPLQQVEPFPSASQWLPSTPSISRWQAACLCSSHTILPVPTKLSCPLRSQLSGRMSPAPLTQSSASTPTTISDMGQKAVGVSWRTYRPTISMVSSPSRRC